MTIYTSTEFRPDSYPVSDRAGDLVVYRGEYVFATAITLAAGDIIQLAQIPPGHVLVDLIVDHDALGTDGVGSAGTLNAAGTDIAVTAVSAQAVAAAGVKRLDSIAGARIAQNETGYTYLGVKVTVSASVAVAVGAKVGLVATYRPAQRNE